MFCLLGLKTSLFNSTKTRKKKKSTSAKTWVAPLSSASVGSQRSHIQGLSRFVIAVEQEKILEPPQILLLQCDLKRHSFLEVHKHSMICNDQVCDQSRYSCRKTEDNMIATNLVKHSPSSHISTNSTLNLYKTKLRQPPLGKSWIWFTLVSQPQQMQTLTS